MPPKRGRKKAKKKSKGVAKSKRRQPGQDGDLPGESGGAHAAAADDDEAVFVSAPHTRRERELAIQLFERGVKYQNGDGVEQSFEQAAPYFRKAAEMELREAQHNLGTFYLEGLGGVPQDFAEAARLYRLASNQGSAVDHLSLGTMYVSGQGVTQDAEEAVRLYRLAADAGLADGQYRLGCHYRDGDIVRQDFAEAARWFQLAVAQEHGLLIAEAQCDLGSLYLDGLGVPQDFDEARRLFELSVAQGLVTAHLQLGKMYEEGWGVEKNVALAKQYYRQAGQKDDLELESGETTQDLMKEYLDAIKHTCASCKTVGDDLKVCTRCKGPRYCSVACQKEDWPEHKRVCQRLSKTDNSDRMAQDANDA